MSIRSLVGHSLVMMAALGGLTPIAAAQSTTFTYQGQLKEAGVPANGVYDMRFRVFTAASAGGVVGFPSCADNVSVVAGLFTTVVDVGDVYNSTQPLWLEIEVRHDTGLGCSTSAGLTVLGPRQRMTATPFATHADTASALAAPDGSPAAAVSVTNAGLVGIGTPSPSGRLHVREASNSNLDVVLDSGLTAPAYSALDFFDRGAFVWGLGKDSNNDFYISPNGGPYRVTLTTAGQFTLNGNLIVTSGHAITVPATTRTKTIHGAAFLPNVVSRDTGAFGNVTTQGLDGYGIGNTPFVASLELPDGAVVTGLCIDAIDELNTDIVASIGRTWLSNDAAEVMGTTFTSGNAPGVVQHPCIGGIALNPIDNTNFAYWVSADLKSFGSAHHRLIAARVTYTVTSPLP